MMAVSFLQFRLQFLWLVAFCPAWSNRVSHHQVSAGGSLIELPTTGNESNESNESAQLQAHDTLNKSHLHTATSANLQDTQPHGHSHTGNVMHFSGSEGEHFGYQSGLVTHVLPEFFASKKTNLMKTSVLMLQAMNLHEQAQLLGVPDTIARMSVFLCMLSLFLCALLVGCALDACGSASEVVRGMCAPAWAASSPDSERVWSAPEDESHSEEDQDVDAVLRNLKEATDDEGEDKDVGDAIHRLRYELERHQGVYQTRLTGSKES